MENVNRAQNSEPKQNWCKIHVTGYWVEPYKQCRQGFLRKEKCIKGNTDKEVNKHE